MQDLAAFLTRSVVAHPDQVQIQTVEGAASLLLELRVHPDDARYLRAENGELLRAMQVILSAASGPQKAVLDLIDNARMDAAEE